MKYFTRHWLEGELTEEETQSRIQAYRDHLQEILPSLPEELATLATRMDLHDAKIRHVLVDRSGSALHLELRCGDQVRGYADIDLIYGDVDFGRSAVAALKSLAQNEQTEMLRDEVDLWDGNLLVHRMIFWPAHAIEIVFGTFGFGWRTVPNREFERDSEAYVELR